MTVGHPAINLFLFKRNTASEQYYAMLGVLSPDIFYYIATFVAVTVLGIPDSINRFYLVRGSHSFFIWLIAVEIFYVTRLLQNTKVKYFCLGWFLHILEDVISHKWTGRGSALEFQKYLFPFPVKLEGFFHHDLWPFNYIEIVVSLAIFIIFRKNILEILKYALGAIRLQKN